MLKENEIRGIKTLDLKPINYFCMLLQTCFTYYIIFEAT